MSDPAPQGLDPDLLDVPETADFLRIKKSTVRAWILNKRLPYVKLGSRVFLRRSDLLDLISRSLVPVKA
jgi:excisionase family DNA binding protein